MEKMSSSESKDVVKILKKYLDFIPEVPRPKLRGFIRVEHDITNPTDLRKLDRYLDREYKNQQATRENQNIEETTAKAREKLGFFDWIEKRAERKQKEREKELRSLEAEISKIRKKLDQNLSQ